MRDVALQTGESQNRRTRRLLHPSYSYMPCIRIRISIGRPRSVVETSEATAKPEASVRGAPGARARMRVVAGARRSRRQTRWPADCTTHEHEGPRPQLPHPGDRGPRRPRRPAEKNRRISLLICPACLGIVACWFHNLNAPADLGGPHC
jgi:hypothetical protein